jgi:hypothetical protein
MARTSYQNILALPDAAQSWNFDLFFPSIPGSSIDPTGLTYKCKTTSLPASSTDFVKIELHGTAKQEAGRSTYDHSFEATFLETVDYATFQAFRGWRDYMRSWKNNSGASSQAYKVNLELDLYDNGGNLVETIILVGCFPTSIGNVSFDGSNTAAVDMSITFSFDYINDGQSF